jgi:hypothetical protein
MFEIYRRDRELRWAADIPMKHIRDLYAIMATLGHVEAAIHSMRGLDDRALLEEFTRVQEALIGHARELAQQLKWNPSVGPHEPVA